MKDFLDRIGFKRKTNKTVESTTLELTSKTIQQRIFLFGGLVIILMLIIIMRLFYIQIISNESYTKKLENYTRRYDTITTPRGEIKDRNGDLIVTNKITKSIIYYPPTFLKDEDEWELATKFSQNFSTEEIKLNRSDLTDLFIYLHEDLVKERVTAEDLANYPDGKPSNYQFGTLLKSKVSDEDRDSLSEKDINAFKVYQQMIKPTSGGMKEVISSASNNEIAYLAEHNLDYPGFQSFSNWDREYLDNFGLKGILGDVSTRAQGLSSESVDFYLAKGYSRDERMGRSGLEKQYEDLISGNKKIQDIVYSSDGFANSIEIESGTKGNNLIMATDIGLQAEVERIVTKTIEENRGQQFRKYYDSTYVVISDPRNGDVLASVAVKTDKDGNLYNDASLNHLNAVVPGSTVKGAMVYLGLSEGKMSPTEQISDAPIKIAGTPEKSSSQHLVSTNAITALAQSSNVYMFHVAMRIADANYGYNRPLYGIDQADFIKMKNNFAKFGLGVETGIDVPNEEVGYIGKNFQGGFLLDYAIGQYDSYTPMQLSSYINTIANDGVRVKPRYVKSAEDPITGVQVYENPVEILSILEDKTALSYVQQGFRACVTDGLCRGVLNHSRYDVAAKTGTSEVILTLEDGTVVKDAPHSLLVGYAPYESPEVTISCVAPHAFNTRTLNNICQPITNEIFDYYFNNK